MPLRDTLFMIEVAVFRAKFAASSYLGTMVGGSGPRALQKSRARMDYLSLRITGQPEVRRGAVNLTYNDYLVDVNPTGTS